jgi:hypothetical protein
MKAMMRADGITLSRTASSSRMVGDLPPSSSVTRFTVFALVAHDRFAYGHRAYERDLGDVGITHELSADDIATPRDDVQETLREIGLVQRLD